MAKIQLLEELLHRRVSRKEFLQLAVFAILACIGLGGILQRLGLSPKVPSLQAQQPSHTSDSYGSKKA